MGFSAEDVLALKKAEQGGGGFCGVFASLLVFVLVAVVVAVVLSIGGQPGTAVPTTATAISGPTELVLLPTPTLRPTATPSAPLLVPAIEAVMSPTPVQVATVAPTWTPLPTYTAVPSQTPPATHTPPATWTAVPTYTPAPTWTAVPPYLVADYTNDWQASRMAVTRLTWLALVFIGLSVCGLLFAVFRPTDRDLRRVYRLLEMHLLTLLASPTPTHAPVQALPAPVRTTPLSEWQRKRGAPVQNTGVAPVTPVTPVQNTGAAPAEIITVSVLPTEPDVDTAVMEAICALWNEISERGERPSFNRVCNEFFGAKNSDRLAIIRRAVKWGREQGFLVGMYTAVSGGTAVNGDENNELVSG